MRQPILTQRQTLIGPGQTSTFLKQFRFSTNTLGYQGQSPRLWELFCSSLNMQTGKDTGLELSSMCPVGLCWPFRRLQQEEKRGATCSIRRLAMQSEMARSLSVSSRCLFCIHRLSALWTRTQMAPGALAPSQHLPSSLGLAKVACWIEPPLGGPKVCSLLTEPCHARQAAQFGLEVVSTVICLLTPCDSLYMSRRTNRYPLTTFFYMNTINSSSPAHTSHPTIAKQSVRGKEARKRR